MLCGTLIPTNVGTIETYNIICNETDALCGDHIILRQSEGDGRYPDWFGTHCIQVREIEIYETWNQGKSRDCKPGTWMKPGRFQKSSGSPHICIVHLDFRSPNFRRNLFAAGAAICIDSKSVFLVLLKWLVFQEHVHTNFN